MNTSLIDAMTFKVLFTCSVKNFVHRTYISLFKQNFELKKLFNVQQKKFQRTSKKQKKKNSAYEIFYGTVNRA